jgi:hypothetical protein
MVSAKLDALLADLATLARLSVALARARQMPIAA